MRDIPRVLLPELAPLPGQLEAALHSVHVRRRRSLLTFATSVTAALLLVALGGHVRSHDTAGIEPAAPGVARTATAVPTARGHGGETSRASGPRPATPAPAAPVEERAPEPAARRGPVAVTADPAPGLPAGYQERDPIPHRTFIVDPRSTSRSCPTCRTEVVGYTAGRVTFDYGFHPMGRTLVFPTEQEFEVTVRRLTDGAVVWRWGYGQEFENKPHWVEVPAGEQIEWSGAWDLMLDNGRRIPPGDYHFTMRILAQGERDGNNWKLSVFDNGAGISNGS